MIGTDNYHIVINLTPKAYTDYRFSSLSVTALKSNSKSGRDSLMSSKAIEPLKAKLLGKGVVELYREYEVEEASDGAPSASITDCDDTTVAIIAIPTYFTATDILGFIGESYLKHISHIRILKSDKPNRFLLLFKFREIIQAAAFQNRFNGKSFNLMEVETCHAIFVKSVRIIGMNHAESEAKSDLIPFLLEDPFTGSSPTIEQTTQQNATTGITMLELPTCPVCLERMDADVTGLLTIPCQHTFHCQCLSKWKDDSCPICRYSNNLNNREIRHTPRRFSLLHTRPLFSPLPAFSSSNAMSQPRSAGDLENTDTCSSCASQTALWICLVCGNIGCSRYDPQQHSLKHFVDTGHCFAMELDTTRVWDYASDSYIHRLVANESDGKLVELPGKDEAGLGSAKALNSNADKVDAVGLEYSQLLISHLASQREYYEALLLQKNPLADTKRRTSSSYLDHVSQQTLQTQINELSLKMSQLTQETLPSLRQKITAKNERIVALSHDLDTANAFNEALSRKVDHLEAETVTLTKALKEAGSENTSLKEQVTDLMFFLDSSEKFKHELDDAKNGTIVVQQKPSSSSARKSQLKRNR